MCGIVGWFNPRGFREDEARPILSAMTDTLHHRGPDASGMWLDGDAGIAMGFRRLAIIDLSAGGSQPMHTSSGRYTVCFNGEIYNFRRLRHELEGLGHVFGSHSDTEVLLASVNQWGVRGALERFNGMFAFALWDGEERVLHLCRDRAGEKPMHYGWVGDTLLYASELKALRAHPLFQGEIDRGALARFLRRGYLGAPLTIYRGLKKLPQGTALSVSASRRHATPEPYWTWREVAQRGAANRFTGTAQEAIDELDTLLRDAVALRLESDVPLGAFLSGGVDSSLIAAVMQSLTDRPIQTFTIGFNEKRFDEAPHAAAVAKHLGTDHTTLYATPEEAWGVVPRLPELYDEPFTDSSQIPTFLVAKMAREHVTVCLSGDAGDELFGGYNHYARGAVLSRALGWVPRIGRTKVAALLRTSAGSNGWLVSTLNGLGQRLGATRSPVERLRQAADVLSIDPPEALYHYMMSYWRDPSVAVPGVDEPLDALATEPELPRLLSPVEQMMFLDAITWLPGDILVKVDRASMAVSLEARIPLLDPRIIEFAWRLPPALKMRGTSGKWLLRQLAYRYVPATLLDRPKHGFDAPIGEWLRGPLRPWAEDLLDEQLIKRQGYLAADPVRRQWEAFVTGRVNRSYEVWAVLVFQAWLEAQERYCLSAAPVELPLASSP